MLAYRVKVRMRSRHKGLPVLARRRELTVTIQANLRNDDWGGLPLNLKARPSSAAAKPSAAVPGRLRAGNSTRACLGN